ncbi:hypothetical protein R3P38DRAFT_3215476 [Favolaschia claudopus]|uniref:Uncharacterized protein n=1 Tax=Favolaschia claudopus TaxID=2862362 RepID=A0AAW0A7P9_9AGAR
MHLYIGIEEVNEGKLLAHRGRESRRRLANHLVRPPAVLRQDQRRLNRRRPPSGVPFIDLQAGFYGTNLLRVIPPLLMKRPVPATLAVPFIDIAEDYGLWAWYMLYDGRGICSMNNCLHGIAYLISSLGLKR